MDGLFDVEPDGLAPVRRWSWRTHGPGDRHDWALAAGAALLSGGEPPPFPSTIPGDAEHRLAIVRRLLGLDDDVVGPLRYPRQS